MLNIIGPASTNTENSSHIDLCNHIQLYCCTIFLFIYLFIYLPYKLFYYSIVMLCLCCKTKVYLQTVTKLISLSTRNHYVYHSTSIVVRLSFFKGYFIVFNVIC